MRPKKTYKYKNKSLGIYIYIYISLCYHWLRQAHFFRLLLAHLTFTLRQLRAEQLLCGANLRPRCWRQLDGHFPVEKGVNKNSIYNQPTKNHFLKNPPSDFLIFFWMAGVQRSRNWIRMNQAICSKIMGSAATTNASHYTCTKKPVFENMGEKPLFRKLSNLKCNFLKLRASHLAVLSDGEHTAKRRICSSLSWTKLANFLRGKKPVIFRIFHGNVEAPTYTTSFYTGIFWTKGNHVQFKLRAGSSHFIPPNRRNY